MLYSCILKMLPNSVLILLLLVTAVVSQNLNAALKKNKKVLYFEAKDEKINQVLNKTVQSDSVICPDGSECPDGSTCCQQATGSFGCCPLPDAVCCSDYVHCCPNGYTCDETAGLCVKGKDVVNWLTKVTKPVEKSAKCANGFECPSGNTCCQLSSGEYGCCPLEKAVCCSDHIHCCPNGYSCDLSSGTCNQGNDVMSWLTKTVARPENARVIGQEKCDCPSHATCCELGSGEYACCPFEKAVCCTDKLHCCPFGYKCDLSAGSCILGVDVMNWFTKTEAKQSKLPLEQITNPVKQPSVNRVVCPNGEAFCPDGNSCCHMYPTREYGCCPFPKAVCCFLHCCPEGYTCNDTFGTCDKGRNALPRLTRQPIMPAVKDV